MLSPTCATIERLVSNHTTSASTAIEFVLQARPKPHPAIARSSSASLARHLHRSLVKCMLVWTDARKLTYSHEGNGITCCRPPWIQDMWDATWVRVDSDIEAVPINPVASLILNWTACFWTGFLSGLVLFLGLDSSCIGRREQFDPMSIGILDERLEGAVGSSLACQSRCTACVEMSFPLVKRIDPQGKVPAAMMGMNWRLAFPDQMQFLIRTQSKPGAGEIKCWPIHHQKPHRVAIESNACIHVGDMNCDMIELNNLHRMLQRV
jgi:hypothetical protein